MSRLCIARAANCVCVDCTVPEDFIGLTEHCIFATTKKRLPYKVSPEGKRCQGKTGFNAPKTVHSRKPKEMRSMIELVSYEPRIEIFARERFPGWDVWGDEV